jgi:hypothetical protein
LRVASACVTRAPASPCHRTHSAGMVRPSA